jgi:hypothetical protein
MPLNSQQLGDLVMRARAKAPPVITPPPAPSRPRQTARPRPAAPAPQASSVAPPAPEPKASARRRSPPLTVPPADIPDGWVLGRESCSTVGSTPSSAGRCDRANTPTCSTRSLTGPSISARIAGGSRCRTAAGLSRSVPPADGSSPSCSRTGSRRLRRLRQRSPAITNSPEQRKARTLGGAAQRIAMASAIRAAGLRLANGAAIRGGRRGSSPGRFAVLAARTVGSGRLMSAACSLNRSTRRRVARGNDHYQSSSLIPACLNRGSVTRSSLRISALMRRRSMSHLRLPGSH